MAVNLEGKEKNPSQSHWDNTVSGDLRNAEQNSSSTEGINTNSNKPTGNIDNVSNAEKNQPPPPGSKVKSSDEKTSSSLGDNKKSIGAQLTSKKVTPFYVLVGLFLLSFGALLLMQMPGLVGVVAINSIMNNLYDSLNSAELRAGHKFSAKMANKPLRGCKKAMSIRCSYKSASKTQLNKLRKAGFEVETGKKGAFNRTRIKSITYIDQSGVKQRVTAREFRKMYRKDPGFASTVNKAYSPRWAMFRDAAARKVHQKLKINLERLSGGSKAQSKAENNQRIRDGDGTSESRVRRTTAPGADSAAVEADPQRKMEAETGKSELTKKSSGLKSSMAAGFRAANWITGTHATVCALIATTEAVSLMARLHSFAQSIQLYTLMANIAHSQIYGEATPEAVELMGDYMTSRDMNETVFSEKSIASDDASLVDTLLSSNSRDPEMKPQPNPHLGKSPMDSAGMIAATTGTPPPLDMRESQYVMGGGMAGTFSSLVKKLREKSQAVSRDSCAVWTNPLVQLGGLIISVGAIVLSGGTAAPLSTARSAGIIALYFFGMKYLTGRISDMSSGELYNTDLEGVDAGNALYSGGAATYSTMASSRGLTPVSTKGSVDNLMAMQQETLAIHERVARYEARSEPFNIYNQYSFLGSIVWSMNPASLQSLSRVGLALRTPSIIFSSLGSLISPKANASVVSDPRRFDQCRDPSYVGGSYEDDGGINLPTADFMCHIRYGNDPIHLNSDPERVIDWMVDSGQVNDGGDPITDAGTMKAIAEQYDDRTANTEEVEFVHEPAPGPYTIPKQEGGINPDGLGAFLDEDDKDSEDDDILAMLPSRERALDLSVADVLRPNNETLADMGIPIDTPTNKLVTYTPAYRSIKLSSIESDIAANKAAIGDDRNYLPPPLGHPNKRLGKNEVFKLAKGQESDVFDDYDPVKDVRTYAHWLRFCRFGDEDGRTVQIGDVDGLEPDGLAEKLLTGVTIKQYASDGRECLESNTCKPGDDPNGADWNPRKNLLSVDYGGKYRAWDGEEAMRKRCRPPVYDIYSIHHMDKSIEDGMDEEEGDESEGDVTGTLDWPSEGGVITSCFGPRGGENHAALDIAADHRSDVKAADGGEVIAVSHNQTPYSGFGETVVIKHKEDLYTRYSHLDTGTIVVKEGDKVNKGDVVGKQGNTGFSDGSHLDFGVGTGVPLQNNNDNDFAVNPLKYLTIPSGVINQSGCTENDTL